MTTAPNIELFHKTPVLYVNDRNTINKEHLYTSTCMCFIPSLMYGSGNHIFHLSPSYYTKAKLHPIFNVALTCLCVAGLLPTFTYDTSIILL